jgi:MFS transporter, putative metabolite:H+ symporter
MTTLEAKRGSHWQREVALLLVAAALGYFVDVYDLIILSVVRKASLAGLGVPEADMLRVGLRLLNIQIAGVLIGGVMWGILGDKRGRLAVLFGSITLYSVANLLNAYISSIAQYECLRFIAGFGLAGELGAGITIVSEVVGRQYRGVATMCIAALGLLGAVLASVIGVHFDWRTSYLIGGILGVCLLILRIGTAESSLFRKIQNASLSRGSLVLLFRDGRRVKRYLLCILAGTPVYFAIGILITGSPEFGKNEGLNPAPSAGIAVLWFYISCSIADVACSALSQWWRSRRMALSIFLILSLIASVVFVIVRSPSVQFFYGKCAFLGFGIGLWAVLNTNAAEQFGTNLRATVATTVPNFVRALLIPISFIFDALKPAIGLSCAAPFEILRYLPLQWRHATESGLHIGHFGSRRKDDARLDRARGEKN